MKNNGGIEQVIGREGETATFLSRCVVSFSLRVFGFAPRQRRRSAFLEKKLNANCLFEN